MGNIFRKKERSQTESSPDISVISTETPLANVNIPKPDQAAKSTLDLIAAPDRDPEPGERNPTLRDLPRSKRGADGTTTVTGPVRQFQRPPSEVTRGNHNEPQGDGRVHPWQVFTPARPKVAENMLVGRRREISRVVSAIEEESSSVVLYGARGVGKTSVAGIIAANAEETGYLVFRYACNSQTSYDNIFRFVVNNISSEFAERWVRTSFGDISNLGELLPPGQIGPSEVTYALSHLKLNHAIIIIDDFDKAKNMQLRRMISETIKSCADSHLRVSLMLVGVADSVTEILGSQSAILRHVVGVRLPLMTNAELNNIIRAREAALTIEFAPSIVDCIVAFSKGSPYYTHLFCLHAANVADNRNHKNVTLEDLKAALDIVYHETDTSIKTAYQQATRFGDSEFSADVIKAAARCNHDIYGSFSPQTVASVLASATEREVSHLSLMRVIKKLCEPKSGPILKQVESDTKTAKFSFAQTGMCQYILLRHAMENGAF